MSFKKSNIVKNVAYNSYKFILYTFHCSKYTVNHFFTPLNNKRYSFSADFMFSEKKEQAYRMVRTLTDGDAVPSFTFSKNLMVVCGLQMATLCQMN